ncbi:MAG TPA: zinc finger domain-containing protein, partial [Myxococcota bacterium]|jgi:formamidopyrimidine-DNA glycosylase
LLDDAAAHLSDLGPEPLDDAFTVDVLAGILRGKKRPVKAVLLDQSAIAGVGNIYSDESCFLAQIHPATLASALDASAIKRLHKAIRQSLTDSIKALSDDDGEIAWRYQNRQGESPFKVYDRAGEPCKRCKKKLVSSRVAGRATVTCPHCQKKPARSK